MISRCRGGEVIAADRVSDAEAECQTQAIGGREYTFCASCSAEIAVSLLRSRARNGEVSTERISLREHPRAGAVAGGAARRAAGGPVAGREPQAIAMAIDPSAPAPPQINTGQPGTTVFGCQPNSWR